jgi:hypothetical protein
MLVVYILVLLGFRYARIRSLRSTTLRLANARRNVIYGRPLAASFWGSTLAAAIHGDVKPIIRRYKLSTPESLKCIQLEKFGIKFDDKPILVGGMALEYYGIRKHGDDFDFIISNRDYKKLENKYRNCRKDMWGDFGIRVDEYELFRSMWKFDYSYFDVDTNVFDKIKVVSVNLLFRMKVFAINSDEKHRNDIELMKKYFEKYQNKEYLEYMNKNVERYLKVPNGLIINGDYY